MNCSEVTPNKKVMPPGRKECNSVILGILILSCSFYPADRSLAGNWHKNVNRKRRHLHSKSPVSFQLWMAETAPWLHLSGFPWSDLDVGRWMCFHPAKRWNVHAHSPADLPHTELQAKCSSLPQLLPERVFSLIDYGTDLKLFIVQMKSANPGLGM